MISAEVDAPNGPTAPIDPDSWFRTQVLPLDGRLRGWLKARYPKALEHDDIVQEAYLRLLKVYRRDGRIPNVRALLHTIARNLALDAIRRRRNSPFDEISFAQACAICGSEPSSREAAERKLEAELVAEAIGHLPPRCRRAIELRFQEGLSTAELSERMAITQGTVLTQLSKAVRSCAQYLREKGAIDHAPMITADSPRASSRPPTRRDTRSPRRGSNGTSCPSAAG